MRKKLGYTLAEVLIALGIVGFISAIMLPVVNRIKPDPIKVMFITTYDAIVNATHELTANTGIYPIVDNAKKYKYNNAPLHNIDAIDIGGKTFGGDNSKYCQMLGLSLNIIGDTTCSKDPVVYSDSTFANNISFTGTNGIQYLISTDRSLTSSSASYQSDVYFDVNGTEGKNCMYSSSCKNPDRFHLIVSADGAVFPADGISANFLKTRTDWTKKKNFAEDVETLGDLKHLQPVYIANVEPYYGYNCMESYIASQGTYGDPTASCAGKTIYMETTPNEPATQAEANEACKAKGMVLPYYFQLSAAGNFGEELGLTSGNYWATPGTDNKGRVCYLPTGNCGEHDRNAKLQYRCVKPYN